jgi:hypothetical protein
MSFAIDLSLPDSGKRLNEATGQVDGSDEGPNGRLNRGSIEMRRNVPIGIESIATISGDVGL